MLCSSCTASAAYEQEAFALFLIRKSNWKCMLSNNFMHETKKLAFLDLTHSTEGFAL